MAFTSSCRNTVIENENQTPLPATFSVKPFNETNINQSQLFTHLKVLSSNRFAGRKIATAGNKAARHYIIKALTHLNIPPLAHQYQHAFVHQSLLKKQAGKNIIAMVKGDTFPQQYIVLTAHYDHLGKKGRKIFNGADDNASGTAALLAIAEQVAKIKTRYSIIFLFTDGEESNLLGAEAFAKDYQKLFPLIKLSINLDMIAGSSRTKKLHFISKGLDPIINTKYYQALLQQTNITVKKGFRTYKRTSTTRTNWNLASDHAIFYRANIPFIYFGVGDHKNYHTENDIYEQVNLPFYYSATQYIYQQLLFFDQIFI